MSEKKSFWTTVPGILTGTAAMITAIGGLLLVLYQINIIGPNKQPRIIDTNTIGTGGGPNEPTPPPPNEPTPPPPNEPTPPPPNEPTPPPPNEPPTPIYKGPDDAVKKVWENLFAQRGNLTDAVDDRITFQGIVLEHGSLQQSYTLDFGGKQNFGRFVIKVLYEYPYTLSREITYNYKEFTTSLEVGDEVSERSLRARKDFDNKWVVTKYDLDGERIRIKVLEIVAKILKTSLDKLTDKKQIFYPDSLDTIEILTELNERFDVSIPDEQAKKIRTVEDSIDCIINLTKSKDQK